MASSIKKFTAKGKDVSKADDLDSKMLSASLAALSNAVLIASLDNSVTKGVNSPGVELGDVYKKTGVFAKSSKFIVGSRLVQTHAESPFALTLEFKIDTEKFREILIGMGAIAGDPPECPEFQEWNGSECVPVPGAEPEPDPEPEPEEESAPTQIPETPQITLSQPEASSTPTHKISTKGSRLALRAKPAAVKVSESASEDNDVKGDLVKMINNGTHVFVLDEGQGHECEWSFVELQVKGEMYLGWAYNKFLQKLSGTPDSLEIKCTNKNLNSLFASDWTQQEIDKPYEDTAAVEWRVPYETEWESTGGNELESRMLEVREGGLRLILEHLSKDDSDEEVERILNAFIGVKSLEYYVDPRPKSLMRVLVTIDSKYIGLLKEKVPVIDEDYVDATSGKVSTKTYEIVPADAKEDVVYSVSLRGDTWENQIKSAASTMRLHATEIDSFDGTVETLDLRKEAERLENLRPKILNLVAANGSVFGPDDSLEVAADENHVPVYVALSSSGGEFKRFKKGMDAFKDSEGVDSKRTMNYFFFHFEIASSTAKPHKMPWTNFLGNFTVPLPDVYPSKPKEETPADISDASVDKNSSTTGNTTADKVDKEISGQKDEEGCLPILEGNLPSLDIKAFVGLEGKLAEDAMLKGNELLTKVWDESKDAKDYIGDTVTSDIQALQDKITTLDDVFMECLNKISIGDLMAAAAKCFDLGKFDFLLDFPDLTLPCLELPPIPTIGLPDSLPTDDIMADLSEAIAGMIMDLLTQVFVEMIKDILDQLLDFCDAMKDDDFGKEDINEKLEDSVPKGPLSHEAANNLKLGIMAAAGLFPDRKTPSHPDEQQEAIDCITGLFEDVSALLTPSELCRLLKGRASGQTLALIRSLIKRKHPCVADRLKTKTAIADLFILIGNVVDSSWCEDLSRRGPRMIPIGGKIPCDDDGVVGSLREELLRAKGDGDGSGDAAGSGGISDEQVQELLDKARDRRKQQAKKLADNMGKIKDLMDGKENPFAAPPLFCGKGPTGEPIPGLIELTHPSADFMLDKVMHTMYEPVYMAFNRDAKDFAPTIIQNTNEKVAIPLKLDHNGTEVWHPEILKMEGHGVDRDMIEANAIPNLYARTDNEMVPGVWVDMAQRQVSPQLRGLLRQMEINGSFNTKLDIEGMYFELVLPQESTVLDGVDELKKQFDQVYEMLPSDSEFVDETHPNYQPFPDFTLLSTIVPEWKVRYKVPWQHRDKNSTVQDIDDEYIVEIFPNDEYDSENGFKTLVEEEITQPVKDYIQSPWGGVDLWGTSAGGLGMTIDFGEEDDDTDEEGIDFQIAADITSAAEEFNDDIEAANAAKDLLKRASQECIVLVPAFNDYYAAHYGYIVFDVCPCLYDDCEPPNIIGHGTSRGRVTLPYDLWELLQSANSADEIYNAIMNMSDEERCVAIRLVLSGEVGNLFPELIERLEPFLEGCELVIEDLADSPSYMPPPPHAVFGKHVANVWTDSIKEVPQYSVSPGSYLATNQSNDQDELANLGTLQSELENYYTHYVHPQISKDLLSLLAYQVSDSILFGNKEFSIQGDKSGGAAMIQSRQPYLEMLKFSINPTPTQLACGVWPHLLNIDEFKEQAKQNFKDSGGLCGDLSKVKTDGSKNEEQNALEDSVLDTLVLITIRAYMIDFFLRGIFPFTEFKIEETLDGYLVEFITEKIYSELASFSALYLEQFTDRANKVYVDLVNSGEIDWAPIKEMEQVGADEGFDGAVEEKEMQKKGLRELCKYQLFSVAHDISEIVKRDLPGISPNNKNIHEWFLEDWLALIDIADYEVVESGEDVADGTSDKRVWSTRFSEPESTLTTLKALEEKTAARIAAEYGAGSAFNALFENIESGSTLDATPEGGDHFTTAQDARKDYNYKTWNDYLDQVTSGDASGRQKITLKTQFSNNGRPFSLENGNLFLEKYVRIVRRSEEDIRNRLGNPQTTEDDDGNTITLQAILSDGEVGRYEYVYDQYGNVVENIAELNQQRDLDGGGEEGIGWQQEWVVSAELDEIIELFYSLLPNPTQGGEDAILTSGDVRTSVEDYVTKDKAHKWLANFKSELENHRVLRGKADVLESITYNEFFEEISVGMRLVHVTPITNEQFVDSSDNNGKEFVGLTGADLSAFYNTGLDSFGKEKNNADMDWSVLQKQGIKDRVVDARNRKKAFSVPEQLLNIESVSSTIGEGTIENSDLVRELHLTPLVDTAWSREIGDDQSWRVYSTKSIANYLPTMEMTSNRASTLKKKMRSSREYQTLFYFCFPLERYLGLITVYNIMGVSAMPNVPLIFANTKSELHRLWWILMSGGDYTYEDPVMKMVGQNQGTQSMLDGIGSALEKCLGFSFGLPDFSLPGIDIIVKFSIKTPPLIFKGIVEFIDPNIKLAKWICDLGKLLGMCLPIPLISFGLLPINIFGQSPIGIGIGPPITPLGFIYLAMGFGSFEFNSDDLLAEEDDDTNFLASVGAVDLQSCAEDKTEEEEAIQAMKDKLDMQKGKEQDT